MNKYIFFITVLFAFVIYNKAEAYDFSALNDDGKTIYYNIITDGVEVTHKSFLEHIYEGDLNIPSSVTNEGTTYSVTAIGKEAFSFCDRLTSVSLPGSITVIKATAFYWCCGIASIELPASLTAIGDDAFAGCKQLTSIAIPDAVASIGNGTFYCCDKLEKFTGKFATEDGRCLIVCGQMKAFAPAGVSSYAIPDNVTAINEYTFYLCEGLNSLEIPSSVTAIERYALYGCTGLNTLTVRADNPSAITIGEGAFNEVPASTCQLLVPALSIKAYAAADVWKNFTNIKAIPGTEPLALCLPYGKVKIPNAEGTTLQIQADAGYKFHSATLGGDDVTADVDANGNYTVPLALGENPELTVVFVKDAVTGIEDISGSDNTQMRVRAFGNEVLVEGAPEGSIINLYDIGGHLIHSGTETRFTTAHRGVMLLTVGGKTYKFYIN